MCCTVFFVLMYLRVPRGYYGRVAQSSGEPAIQILRQRALWAALLCIGVIAWIISPKIFGVEGQQASRAVQTGILGALGLGLYTCVGLRFYSILISRTKSDLFRFLLFLVCVALLILTPFLGWVALLQGFRLESKAQRLAWLFLTFFCWMGPFWAYAIANWRVLNERLRLPKNSATGDPSLS
jgi:hypothetical protein